MHYSLKFVVTELDKQIPFIYEDTSFLILRQLAGLFFVCMLKRYTLLFDITSILFAQIFHTFRLLEDKNLEVKSAHKQDCTNCDKLVLLQERKIPKQHIVKSQIISTRFTLDAKHTYQEGSTFVSWISIARYIYQFNGHTASGY